MGFSTSILFGLAAMLFWGVGDFFSAIAARKIGAFKAAVLTQLIALAPIALLAATLSWNIPLNAFLLVAAAGAFSAVGVFTFFYSVEKKLVSVTAGVYACWGAVTAILSILFLHESLGLAQAIAVATAVCGAILVSTRSSDLSLGKLRKIAASIGLFYAALLSMLAGGVAAFLAKINSASIGSMQAMCLTWTLVPFFLLASTPFAAKRGARLTSSARLPLGLLAATALSLFAGSLAFYKGIEAGFAALIAPLAATHPLPTILLSRVFFKEKLDATQYAGAALIILAIIILST